MSETAPVRRPKPPVEQREARRLRRIFARALLVALAAPVAAFPFACSEAPAGTTGPGGSSTGQTSTGGSTTATSGTGASTGTDTSTDTITDGGAPEASPCDPVNFEPDPPDNCGEYYRLACGLPPGVVPANNCYLTPNDCLPICGRLAFNCHSVGASCVDGGVVNDPDGGIDIDCATCPGGLGRVPAGLERANPTMATSPLGDYFARAAHLEAASVHAFRRLHTELSAHGAPAHLLRAARKAERDEVRHTRLCARHSQRFGSTPAPAVVTPVGTRLLEEIAIENAVEGCLRETFGAAVAHYQARSAQDPEIARDMLSIARDETSHAALSWAVLRWSKHRLSREARARLTERCRATIADLRREIQKPVAAEVMSAAGVPGAQQQRALLATLEQDLWRELTS